MTPASLKRARQAHEVNEAARRQAAVNKTKQMQQRRLDADERKFLKESGVEL
jgi:hypothetical protein